MIETRLKKQAKHIEKRKAGLGFVGFDYVPVNTGVAARRKNRPSCVASPNRHASAARHRNSRRISDDEQIRSTPVISRDPMKRYDPLEAPNPAEWLSLDEGERILLVSEYHRRAKPRPPNARAHAAIHVIVENQIALGDEYPVRHTADRLIGESLDRHEAVHAIGSVLAEHMHDILHDPPPGANLNERYLAALAQLTAEGWRG